MTYPNREADALAYCRQGLAADEIITLLSAITGRMKYDDPICIALDKCIEALETVADNAAEAELWTQDDKDCKRAQSLLPAASIPGFPRPDFSFLTIIAKEPAL